MAATGVFQILFFFALILAVTKPMGVFMARVFEGERTFLHPVLGWLERVMYRLCSRRRTAG
jgi:K+-transporting ATPase ATPase A chain